MQTDHVVALISRLRDAAHSLILRELARHGVCDLAPSHGAIMDELYRHSSLKMNDLARRIGRDKSTVTALVNKLGQLGYVRKRRSRQDCRATEVTLTAKGRSLQPVFERVSHLLLDRFYAGFTPDRAENLVVELEAALRNLKIPATNKLHDSSELTDTQRRII